MLDALGVGRVFVHGTSMGGSIAMTFTAKYPERTIACCADCTSARPDRARTALFRFWRVASEYLPPDELWIS